MEEKQSKKEKTVIHLYLKRKGLHYYFGSKANIFEHFTKEEIGISWGSLRNYDLNLSPYKNDKVIIRKGTLQTKSQKNPPKSD